MLLLLAHMPHKPSKRDFFASVMDLAGCSETAGWETHQRVSSGLVDDKARHKATVITGHKSSNWRAYQWLLLLHLQQQQQQHQQSDITHCTVSPVNGCWRGSTLQKSLTNLIVNSSLADHPSWSLFISPPPSKNPCTLPLVLEKDNTPFNYPILNSRSLKNSFINRCLFQFRWFLHYSLMCFLNFVHIVR